MGMFSILTESINFDRSLLLSFVKRLKNSNDRICEATMNNDQILDIFSS